MAAAGNGKLLA